MPTNYLSLLHPQGEPPSAPYAVLLQRLSAPAQQPNPYQERLAQLLDDAAAATLASGSPNDDGVLARISIYGQGYWFVSMRDLKFEMDAYGTKNLRAVRAAMKSLGWRSRRCFAWGCRHAGFTKRREYKMVSLP